MKKLCVSVLLFAVWFMLAASTVNADSAILTWLDNSPSAGMDNAETGQRVWRKLPGDTLWSILAEVGANATYYVDEFSANGICYRVSAYNSAGETHSLPICYQAINVDAWCLKHPTHSKCQPCPC